MNNNALSLYILIALSIAPAGGCSSMRSTYIGNPTNGETTDGIPIVVERPRYLRVTEREVVYTLVGNTRDPKKQNSSDSQEPANNPNSNNSTSKSNTLSILKSINGVVVDYEVITVGEVYTVDFRRPGAGKGEFTLEFPDGGQYPTKVVGKSEDETIKQVGESIAQLVEKGIKGLTPTSGELAAAMQEAGIQVSVVESTKQILRVRLYDLDRLAEDNYEPIELFSSENSSGCETNEEG